MYLFSANLQTTIREVLVCGVKMRCTAWQCIQLTNAFYHIKELSIENTSVVTQSEW